MKLHFEWRRNKDTTYGVKELETKDIVCEKETFPECLSLYPVFLAIETEVMPPLNQHGMVQLAKQINVWCLFQGYVNSDVNT